MSVGRHRLVAVVVVAVAGLSACSASEPGGPTAAPPSTVTSAPTEPPAASPSAASPSSSGTPSGSPSTSLSGVTLRQLGFANGPSDEFSLPSDLVLTTSVDQPNVVTLVLARPSPQTVEEYLRATLPGRGFTIDARADVGQALAFAGHGWTGVFTGTGTTTAVVLRPA